MQTNKYVVFVVLIINIILYSINGYPTPGIRQKLINFRNIGDKWKIGHDSLLSILFNKTYSPPSPEIKLPYNTEELLESCKNEKGEQRISCVASYIRNLFPDIFSRSKDVGKHTSIKYNRTTTTTTTSTPVSTTRSMLLSVSSTTSPPPSACHTRMDVLKTNRESRKELGSTKTKAEHFKADDTSLSSAFLIVPGDPKIITPIIQDTETRIPRIFTQNAKIKPITCRKDEFGFADDVDPTIVDIAHDMLCSLCKHQGDSLCIVRWCFNITSAAT
ncbi:uncharacterized protein LOC123527965 [Mercenaria mercenaria]|uniref:uncharacterized protein LOC123527965 n=1 Tax=Mercenaria mercenaria TaxID=6596 RepID=UPI00234F6E88|nr:uncharacterized protein LOC123527965 [Mercenaria mercenaria]